MAFQIFGMHKSIAKMALKSFRILYGLQKAIWHSAKWANFIDFLRKLGIFHPKLYQGASESHKGMCFHQYFHEKHSHFQGKGGGAESHMAFRKFGKLS
jgi:hypothetical protein